MDSFKCLVDESKLRTHNGIMKTEGLFWENASKARCIAKRLDPDPVYTLKDYDHNGYPSMYKIYIDSATEYEAAMKILGSWKHWKKLCGSSFFKEFIEEWREERALREESLAKTALLESISEGNVSAAKTILEGKKKRTAGRPSREEVSGELKRAVDDHDQLSSIVKRMQSVG